jgi:hypothetical protein
MDLAVLQDVRGYEVADNFKEIGKSAEPRERELKVETRIKNGVLIISIPMQEPKLSASQKSLVVATSRGKQRTALKVDGRSIFVIANAFLEVNQTNGTHSAKLRATRGKK